MTVRVRSAKLGKCFFQVLVFLGGLVRLVERLGRSSCINPAALVVAGLAEVDCDAANGAEV